ncbi:Universal stress protein [Streptomyces sp. RB5]|uniref:Universal stress protein n=1 Tax=Streptomyces smaragdinus TaxID=2585196 RepID=A0A7K0CFF0_9ACTN|nr:universal stress protein [Streptomyces smaragdinus]MQY12200.1 Universal stress protein [Streptomyces smaragdinus]
METGPVLVGVDGSEAGLEAVTVAAHEARLRGCPLRVVHAFLWPPSGVYLGATMVGTEYTVFREQADKLVKDSVQHAHEAEPGIEIEGIVVTGESLPVMVQETESARLAVVGSRGHGAFARLLLGSTATHLSAHARCPVLVVRGRPDPGGPVLLAVDGSAAGEAAVDYAFAEADRRGTGVVAVHIWSAWDSQAPRPSDAALPEGANPGELVLAEALAGPLEQYPDVSVERRSIKGSARELLIDASGSAGLVVVGARGHGGFTGMLLGSVSQALLNHAHCPVIVVRGTDPDA